MTRERFIDYVFSFYGPESDLYPIECVTKKLISETLDVLINRGDSVEFDSIDREKVRDIILRGRQEKLTKITKAAKEMTELLYRTRPNKTKIGA